MVSHYVKRAIRAVTLVSLTIIIGISLSSCQTQQTIKEPQALRTYWGDKQTIQDFLNSPEAKSNRWVVEAVGE